MADEMKTGVDVASELVKPEPSAARAAVLRAIDELRFGTVEVVIHQSRISEIRQTRRVRWEA